MNGLSKIKKADGLTHRLRGGRKVKGFLNWVIEAKTVPL